MALRLIPRPQPSAAMVYGAPLIAAGLTVLTGLVLFAALGRDPLAGFETFFVHPLIDLNGWSELLVKASPLMLCAIGLAACFRASVWNIGAEGQLIVGGIASGGVALWLFDSTSPLVLPAMVVAGALGGMAWAAIPAFLRTRFNANETLTSLMFTYVADLLLNFLVRGPWRDPEGRNFPQSRQFPDSHLFSPLFEGLRVNTSIFITLAVMIAGWFFLQRSFAGYRLRVGGMAPGAARYAGFSGSANVWVGLLVSGATAGLAGVGEVAGPIGQLMTTISPGYGFAAIIVAYVGRLNPIGIFFASLLMSLLYLGGESAQVVLNLPSAVTGIFQGLLLFYLLGADVFVNYRLDMGQRAGPAGSPG